MRDNFKDNEHWRDCAEFCAKYDQNSFDPDYDTLPIETFVPMLEKVLSKTKNQFIKQTKFFFFFALLLQLIKRVSNLFLVLYSSGSGVIGINAAIFGTWVLIFYNQVLGLSPLLASLALGVALVFDAITDPLIGAWSDRFKSKWGRRHPFIYLSIFSFEL